MSKQDNVSIKSQIDELEQLVSWFEGEDFALDGAVEKIEAAKKLASEIERRLSELKNSVEVLKEDFSRE